MRFSNSKARDITRGRLRERTDITADYMRLNGKNSFWSGEIAGHIFVQQERGRTREELEDVDVEILKVGGKVQVSLLYLR